MVHQSNQTPAVSAPTEVDAADGAPASVEAPLPPLSALKGLKANHTKAFNALSAEYSQATLHLTNIFFPEDPTQIPVDDEERKVLAEKIEDELGVLAYYISDMPTKLSRFVAARQHLSAMRVHPDLTPEVLTSLDSALADIKADETMTNADSLLEQLKSLVLIYERGLSTLRPSEVVQTLRPSEVVQTPARAPLPSNPPVQFPATGSSSDPGTVRPSRQYPVVPSFPDIQYQMFEQKLDHQTEVMSSVMMKGFARIESALVSGLERGLSQLSLAPLGTHPSSFPISPPHIDHGVIHNNLPSNSTRLSHPTYNRSAPQFTDEQRQLAQQQPQPSCPIPTSSFLHNPPVNNQPPFNPSHSIPHIPALARDPPFVPTEHRPPPSSAFPSAFHSGFTNHNSAREAQYVVRDSPFQHAHHYQDGAAVNEMYQVPPPPPAFQAPPPPPSFPPRTLPGDQNPLSKTSSRLPEIKLATFNGDPKEWRNFKATFEVVVDQRDISDVEKMLHLKQSLQGEALEAIGMFDNSDYAKAWAQVQEVYGHKPYLIERLVRELETIPKAAHSPQAQKACLNQVRGLVSMLPDCEGSTNPILHSLVFNKFSPLILEKLVEKKSADKKSINWTLQQLFSFISDEISLLERKQELLGPAFSLTSVNAMYSNQYHTPPSSSSLRHRSPSPRPAPCTFCKSDKHMAKDCTRTPSIDARRDFIQKNGLCYNCRSANHSFRECPHPPCTVCDRYHDVSICPKYHNWNRDAYRGRSPSAVRSRPGQSPGRFPSKTPSRPTTPSSSPNRSQARTPSRERGRPTEKRPFSEGRSNSKGMDQ